MHLVRLFRKKIGLSLFIFVISTSLVGCGGGGATNTNTPPVANGGATQSVLVGATVALDGSASSDANGDPLSYSWTLSSRPTGSTATLTGATTVAPTFTADLAGTYVATLTVSDGQANSINTTVTITTAPVANAGTAQIVTTGTLVTLDGSASSAANGGLLAYSWTLTSRPTGSTATLTGATSVAPTFTADLAGTYVASLTVNDGNVNSAAATVTMTSTSLDGIYLNWKDAYTLASGTNGISASWAIESSTLRATAEMLIVPTCLTNSKKLLMDGMILVSAGNTGLALLSQTPDSALKVAGGLRLLAQYEKNVAVACSYVAGGSGSLTLSAPFTDVTGLIANTPSNKPGTYSYETIYQNTWLNSAGEFIYMSYTSRPMYGDYMTIAQLYSATSPVNWTGTSVTVYCSVDGLDTTFPTCSSWGLTVDRAVGSINLVNTPITERVSGTSASATTGRSGTMSGSLSFIPF